MKKKKNNRNIQTILVLLLTPYRRKMIKNTLYLTQNSFILLQTLKRNGLITTAYSMMLKVSNLQISLIAPMFN